MKENNFRNPQINLIMSFGVLLIVGGVSYYLGTQTQSIANNSPAINEPKNLSQPTAVPIFIVGQPAEVTQPIQKPSSAGKLITVPSNWQQFTAVDSEFGIKTTLALPPGYSFKFTGSEFTIQNDTDATELWDYSTSVYDNGAGLKNHYDGSSRRAWYQTRLSERGAEDKIMSVQEKSLNNSTYLEMTVHTPSYDSHGALLGTKNTKHYIYVQNSILHMFAPVSDKAYSSAAKIPANIEPILVSLSSSRTK